MKFTSAIAKEELLELYSQSLVNAEKDLLIAILGLGINPDDFEIEHLDEIESSLIPGDDAGKDRVAVIRRLTTLVEVINTKIAALQK